MKKNIRNIIIGVRLVSLLLVIGFFGTQQSIISNSFDSVAISLTDREEGVYINLNGNMEGFNGGGFRFTNTITRTESFNANPEKQPSGFPTVTGIDNKFPLSTEWTEQKDATFNFGYMMWVQTPPYGDWAKGVGGSSNKGIITCRAINKGQVSETDSWRVGLECNIKANYTCPGISTCDNRGYTSGNVKNVFIQKIGYEKLQIYRLENNECIEYNIYEKDELGSDYNSIEQCSNDIVITEIEDNQPQTNEVQESNNNLIESESSPLYFYLIPITIFGLIALIIWMKRKKPRK